MFSRLFIRNVIQAFLDRSFLPSTLLSCSDNGLCGRMHFHLFLPERGPNENVIFGSFSDLFRTLANLEFVYNLS